MPANKFTKAMYKSGTVKAERNAEMLRQRLKSPMPKEGTTSAAGGRSAVKIPAKMPAPKAPKPQVIRTTTMMKPTPARERNSIRETRKK